MITINLDKAKNIFRDKIRLSRESMFAELDIAYQRETEKGLEHADVQHIVAMKQQLRDAPAWPPIESASSVKELKEAWPPFMGDNPYAPL